MKAKRTSKTLKMQSFFSTKASITSLLSTYFIEVYIKGVEVKTFADNKVLNIIPLLNSAFLGGYSLITNS